MIINKVTVGFVIQQFDTDDRRFVGQEFVAADEVTWENQLGERLYHDEEENAELIYGKGGVDEPYLNFDMVQPVTKGEHVFNKDTGHCIRCNCDEDDVYVGGEPCIE